MGVIVKLGYDEGIKKMVSLTAMNDKGGMLANASENPVLPEGKFLDDIRDTSKMYVDSMSSVLGAILGKPVSSDNITVEDARNLMRCVGYHNGPEGEGWLQPDRITESNYHAVMGYTCLKIANDLKGRQTQHDANNSTYAYTAGSDIPLRYTNALTGEDIVFDSRAMFPMEKPKSPGFFKLIANKLTGKYQDEFDAYHKAKEDYKRDVETRARLDERMEKGNSIFVGRQDERVEAANSGSNKAPYDVSKYETMDLSSFDKRVEKMSAALQHPFEAEKLGFTELNMEDG